MSDIALIIAKAASIADVKWCDQESEEMWGRVVAKSIIDALTAANLLIVPREVVEEAANLLEDANLTHCDKMATRLRSYLPATQPDRKEGM